MNPTTYSHFVLLLVIHCWSGVTMTHLPDQLHLPNRFDIRYCNSPRHELAVIILKDDIVDKYTVRYRMDYQPRAYSVIRKVLSVRLHLFRRRDEYRTLQDEPTFGEGVRSGREAFEGLIREHNRQMEVLGAKHRLMGTGVCFTSEPIANSWSSEYSPVLYRVAGHSDTDNHDKYPREMRQEVMLSFISIPSRDLVISIQRPLIIQPDSCQYKLQMQSYSIHRALFRQRPQDAIELQSKQSFVQTVRVLAKLRAKSLDYHRRRDMQPP
ncbi:hypothetical protein BJ170DRAFT_77539 [Xylariales sp. AK1849]|nr:hypothetical protein BJ170DRAFT_77539 [Xylariales sp. AK1849]